MEKASVRRAPIVANPPATILYVVDGLGLSGKTKALADLITRLDESRFRAVVCRFRDEGGPIETRLNDHGVVLREVSCRDGVNLGVITRLARMMREERPAVVHCYNQRSMLYGGLAAKLAGVRATVGSLSAFACLLPDREYGFLPQQLFTLTGKNRMRNRMSCRLMKHVVTVSRSLGEGFCKFNGVGTSRLRIIPYGADMDMVGRHTSEEVNRYRAALGVSPDEVLVGSAGRLVEQKDYPTQLRAFSIAAKRAPNLKMVLAGDGPLRDSLQAMTHELQIEDRVTFLGHIEQVPLLLRSLDVFAMTSKFEPFGVALVEAKSAGLPIITTTATSMHEIVVDGKNGLVSPPGDYEKLAEAFVSLAADAGLRKRLGDQALKEAREHHCLRAIVSSYEQLYDEAIGKRAYAVAIARTRAHPIDQE